MALHSVFYEHVINAENIGHLVRGVNITTRSRTEEQEVIDLIMNSLDSKPKAYIDVRIDGHPGIKMKFSRHLKAERLPHPIEGAQAVIHPSSEGYFDLVDFKHKYTATLNRYRIPYETYD